MTDRPRYQGIERLEVRDAVRAFQTGAPTEVVRALLSLSMYGDDPDLATMWCLFFLGHHDDGVVRAAATSIGHIARAHRRINRAVVLPALEIARAEGRAQGVISDALDDIAMFCSEA